MHKPRVHLATIVGGYIKVLPHMLAHYRALGFDSIFVNVQLSRPDDPVLLEAQTVTDAIGCGIHRAAVYEYTPERNREIFAELRQQYPNDWFVLADQDELQHYSEDLVELVGYCERNGYDYIEGCHFDRVGRDGSLPPVDAARPISRQFPIGGFVGYPLLGAWPKKIAACKGNIRLSWGQHETDDGRGLPVDDELVQVHHYKWVAGLRDRLAARASYRRANNLPHGEESQRFVDLYDESGGRLRLDDPRYRLWDCRRGPYPYWQDIKEFYKCL